MAGVCVAQGRGAVRSGGGDVVSCLLPASAAAGKSVTTVEGIGAPKLHPIQKAFMALDALQCGFCTPGFVVEATAYYENWRKTRGTATPTSAEIARALAGHLYGVAFDLGPCVAPHPSTMAAALLAYDATVATERRLNLTIAQLLGDGTKGAADHALEPGEIIKSIELPPPVAHERALYKRATSRSLAEWPLVEIVLRAAVSDGSFVFVRAAAGGIAPVPLRLSAVEAAATGAPATPATIARATAQSTVGARPLAMTGYKLDLLKGLVQDLMEGVTT
jgi:CO/xanthine dehydrogenase FAD-binding subunit